MFTKLIEISQFSSSYASLGATCSICTFLGAFFFICALQGLYIYQFLDRSIILMAYSRVPSFLSCVFFFRGVTSFELIGLPRFRRILNSFFNYPIQTSIYVGIFAVKICVFVTFFVLMNASSNWFTRFYK